MVYLYKKTSGKNKYFYLRKSTREKGKIIVKDLSYLGTKLQEIINKAKSDKDILAVLLFGSSIERQGRDIDICLVLNKKLTNLEMTKKRMSYMKTDYDIQIFQQLPLYIRSRILKQHFILLNKNEKLLYELVYQTIKELNFYNHIYRDYISYIENGQR